MTDTTVTTIFEKPLTLGEKPRFDNRDPLSRERERVEYARKMLIAAEVDVIRYRLIFDEAIKNFETFIREDERSNR